MIAAPLLPRRVPLAAIPRALASGWALFRAWPALSCGYAAVFALVGLLLLGGVAFAGVTPMALPLAGGFMLVGPVLLAGYFRVARLARESQSPRIGDLVDGFRLAPRSLWAIALLCMLLFMIWVTDAATLYSFMIGRDPVWLRDLPGHADALRFELYGAVMGTALAFAIYTVSAFSVPLLADGRTGLVGAVSASVKAVFGNFIVTMVWALILAAVTILSILLLPLFVVALPWLAYSSYALYSEFFPA
jgi:uncharacterized membrane protein